MTDDELEAAILEARVRGVSERDCAAKFGLTLARVQAILDDHARRYLAPENIIRMLTDGLADLRTIEATYAAKPGLAASRIVKEARRVQARHMAIILQRTTRAVRPT
jgi:hypothetical protein